MKIATWNVERLKHKAGIDKIVGQCEFVGADVLVLTETDQRIVPKYQNCLRTESLHEMDDRFYGKYENRASIYTNYKCVALHETFDKYTSVCAELETEKGNLLVYATIIGVYGNRHPSFLRDLQAQADDIRRLADSTGKPVCIVGDYNISFADNYYFTKAGRNLLMDVFADAQLELLTGDVKECIDHIAVSRGFLKGHRRVEIEEWNHDKSLSDHKGISADIVW